MKVKELIEELLKVKNQDAVIDVPVNDGNYSQLHGIAICESGGSIILCDKETYLAFSEQ